MIPSFSPSGVLPPYDPARSPVDPAAVSPYCVSMLELVQRFYISPERLSILQGLISYRSELRAQGIIDGFQWLDGSFIEDVELIHRRSPGDIDLITFANRPAHVADWNVFVTANPQIFNPGMTKTSFKCDAYYVDLSHVDNKYIVDKTRYWFGLFSHQRYTELWKGMIEVSLQDDDLAASQYLSKGGSNAT